MRFKDPDVALIQPEKNEAWNVLELRTLNGQCFEERGHQVLIFLDRESETHLRKRSGLCLTISYRATSSDLKSPLKSQSKGSLSL